MNKPLLLSLAAATLLSTNLSAESMFERFEAMEKEMNKLKKELAALKANKSTPIDEEEKEEESDEKEIASNEKAEDDDKSEDAEDSEDGEEEIVTNEDRLDELEESVSELTRNTSGSHLKFKVDYRFAVENINYDMADGSKAENNAFMTNRLWINTAYKATNNLSFSAQIAYNKAFGERSGASNTTQNGFENFDWISNENAYDDKLRVRSAYFFYRDTEFMGLDIPWTISIGRRPSTNGHLINFRDDDKASSPLGHAINVEFDGLSSKFVLNKATGTYVKLCMGRGMSNAAPKFTSTPYAEVTNDNTNIDLAGFIFVPYNNRQYAISTMYYYANNLIDQHYSDPVTPTNSFDTVGGLHSMTASLTVSGIGKELSDFLDDTTVFASFSTSKTDPKKGQTMFGSAEKETGSSYWVGAQFPSLFTDNGRWGLEYNHGSKYWRAITYSEDTNIGSKVAARGDAYEAYITESIIEDVLSMQIRYTYIDYDYSGSNGFFGSTTGMPLTMDQAIAFGMGNQVVDKAQDIRFYLRYRY